MIEVRRVSGLFFLFFVFSLVYLHIHNKISWRWDSNVNKFHEYLTRRTEGNFIQYF